MRDARLLSVAAALAVLLAACGSGGGSSSTPPSGSGATAAATKASGTVILATTTSFQDSGLLDALSPMFEEKTGYTLKPVAVGSGQAIEQGSRGDADVVFAHSPDAEKKMVDAGDGIERAIVMHNDFVLVGPAADPAGIKSAASADQAMQKIADARARFISRGDNSGTNAFELKLWAALSVTPKGQSWYEETGQGMGATLQVANQKDAYTLSDRGTYLAQQRNLDLQVLFEGDKALNNVYHVIVVNPDKHPDVNVTGARAFAAFLLSPEIQEFIGQYGIDKYGRALFYPDGGQPEP